MANKKSLRQLDQVISRAEHIFHKLISLERKLTYKNTNLSTASTLVYNFMISNMNEAAERRNALLNKKGSKK